MTTIDWSLSGPDVLKGHSPLVVGHPQPREAGLWFDGLGDGLIVPCDPLTGAEVFTLEAIVKPERGELLEQRFLHLQEDGSDDRIMLETRFGEPGTWYADTFIRSQGQEVALNDPACVHPLGAFYNLTLQCDGRRMWQRVNGRIELEAPIVFGPRGPGRTALGMRMNRLWWFRGILRHVRFTHSLRDTFLQP